MSEMKTSEMRVRHDALRKAIEQVRQLTLKSWPRTHSNPPDVEEWRSTIAALMRCDVDFDTVFRAALATPSAAPSQDERIYPCRECGALRSKAEGGTTFSVCDECWDKLHPKAATPIREPGRTPEWAAGRLAGMEEAALIDDDYLNLDQGEGHPEFFAKYGCVDVGDAIRKQARAAAPPAQEAPTPELTEKVIRCHLCHNIPGAMHVGCKTCEQILNTTLAAQGAPGMREALNDEVDNLRSIADDFESLYLGRQRFSLMDAESLRRIADRLKALAQPGLL